VTQTQPQAHDIRQQIDLVDFTPGIFDDWFSAGGTQAAPDGAAQLTGTFSCVSSPTGGLMAAPLKVQSLQQDLIDTPAGALQYMTNDAQMHILAFRNTSPVSQNSFQGGQGLSQFPDQLWVCYSWLVITNSPTNTLMQEKLRTRAYYAYLSDASGVPQYPFSNSAPAAPNIFDANVNTSGAFAVATPTVDKFPHGAAGIDNERSNTASPLLVGNIVTATSTTRGNSFGAIDNVYPSNATPGLDSTAAVPFSVNQIGTVFGHQGRIVGMRNSFSSPYGTNGFGPTTEILEYANVNNYSVVNTAGAVFVEEHPTGYGSWISMNANQLMLVKQRGGGVSVTGPLENPTVTYLPGIPSTLGATNIGTISADGTYVYGTSRGVFAWAGANSAQNISPQIDGWFWRPQWLNPGTGLAQVDKRYGQYGSFCFVNPFIFAPNNFLYDTRTGGWWKLALPSISQQTYAFWDISANGLAVGCAASVYTAQTEAVAWYDTTRGQPNYQWTSQPLARSRGRFIDIRDVTVLTLGVGTVTVGLQKIDGTIDAAGTQTFTSSSTTTPQLQNQPISCKSTDVVVVLTSNSGGGSPAPRILRVSFGYYESETAR
jgi:hypothetical protein